MTEQILELLADDDGALVCITSYGDIGADEPCDYFEYQRREGVYIEVLVTAGAVYTIRHERGVEHRPCKLVTIEPRRVVEILRRIA